MYKNCVRSSLLFTIALCTLHVCLPSLTQNIHLLDFGSTKTRKSERSRKKSSMLRVSFFYYYRVDNWTYTQSLRLLLLNTANKANLQKKSRSHWIWHLAAFFSHSSTGKVSSALFGVSVWFSVRPTLFQCN